MNGIQNTVSLLQQMITEQRDNNDILLVAKQIVQDLSVQEEKQKDFIVKPGTYFDELEKRTKGEIKSKIIRTGFKDIDNRLYGVFAGEVMTIAARTGIGKTTLGLDIALNMLENHKVGFITLEMTKEDMLDRIMSRECDIYLGSFYSDSFKPRDINNLRQYGPKAREKIDKLVLAYGCFNLEDVLSTINQMVDVGCEVVFIDWLGMINAPGNRRNEQMVTIMTSLKDIATSKNIAIVAMQQLNRQIDGFTREEPELSDIADSSSIEHISSPVLILRKEKGDAKDETMCSIFKARRINEEAKQQCKELSKISGDTRQKIFYTIRFRDDLGHCSFRDYDLPITTI